MKKTITLILLIPQLFFGQTTQIPDSNFEQALISLGYDSGVIDGEIELDVSNFKYGVYHYQLLCPTQSLRTTGKFIKN